MLPISEVINTASKLRKKDQKVQWLRDNNSVVLRNILILTYDQSHELYVGPGAPYQNNPAENGGPMALYRAARKLKYIVKGMAGDNIPQIKREMIMIEIMETVSAEDAKILEQMLERKPFKGLTADTINEAFGPIIKTKGDKAKTDG